MVLGKEVHGLEPSSTTPRLFSSSQLSDVTPSRPPAHVTASQSPSPVREAPRPEPSQGRPTAHTLLPPLLVEPLLSYVATPIALSASPISSHRSPANPSHHQHHHHRHGHHHRHARSLAPTPASLAQARLRPILSPLGLPFEHTPSVAISGPIPHAPPGARQLPFHSLPFALVHSVHAPPLPDTRPPPSPRHPTIDDHPGLATPPPTVGAACTSTHASTHPPRAPVLGSPQNTHLHTLCQPSLPSQTSFSSPFVSDTASTSRARALRSAGCLLLPVARRPLEASAPSAIILADLSIPPARPPVRPRRAASGLCALDTCLRALIASAARSHARHPLLHCTRGISHAGPDDLRRVRPSESPTRARRDVPPRCRSLARARVQMRQVAIRASRFEEDPPASKHTHPTRRVVSRRARTSRVCIHAYMHLLEPLAGPDAPVSIAVHPYLATKISFDGAPVDPAWRVWTVRGRPRPSLLLLARSSWLGWVRFCRRVSGALERSAASGAPPPRFSFHFALRVAREAFFLSSTQYYDPRSSQRPATASVPEDEDESPGRAAFAHKREGLAGGRMGSPLRSSSVRPLGSRGVREGPAAAAAAFWTRLPTTADTLLIRTPATSNRVIQARIHSTAPAPTLRRLTSLETGFDALRPPFCRAPLYLFLSFLLSSVPSFRPGWIAAFIARDKRCGSPFARTRAHTRTRYFCRSPPSRPPADPAPPRPKHSATSLLVRASRQRARAQLSGRQSAIVARGVSIRAADDVASLGLRSSRVPRRSENDDTANAIVAFDRAAVACGHPEPSVRRAAYQFLPQTPSIHPSIGFDQAANRPIGSHQPISPSAKQPIAKRHATACSRGGEFWFRHFKAVERLGLTGHRAHLDISAVSQRPRCLWLLQILARQRSSRQQGSGRSYFQRRRWFEGRHALRTRAHGGRAPHPGTVRPEKRAGLTSLAILVPRCITGHLTPECPSRTCRLPWETVVPPKTHPRRPTRTSSRTRPAQGWAAANAADAVILHPSSTSCSEVRCAIPIALVHPSTTFYERRAIPIGEVIACDEKDSRRPLRSRFASISPRGGIVRHRSTIDPHPPSRYDDTTHPGAWEADKARTLIRRVYKQSHEAQDRSTQRGSPRRTRHRSARHSSSNVRPLAHDPRPRTHIRPSVSNPKAGSSSNSFISEPQTTDTQTQKTPCPPHRRRCADQHARRPSGLCIAQHARPPPTSLSTHSLTSGSKRTRMIERSSSPHTSSVEQPPLDPASSSPSSAQKPVREHRCAQP
ncbi:hypothetical protein HETIRDRAFT_448127 [Heterobasidion irregulare TC 32-1]|uniref:Uncharacterized protein n=1 Tax=Heterobasidion irregulare (strain TC 32-1) TaxID=747525 RepID=W4KQI3_HETIT|nr:uncharacterized protein HETIRDRAFT_448127 [Heterobasidion irregulare TC 32-1]ETW87665.1 hypothetical protein HETIRDRAFT_448127 [Heterobasidion irregulare TC 32-1]